MSFNNKNIASLFVCLLIFNALSTHALAAPNRYRNGKGLAFSKNLQDKQISVPNTLLVQKWDKGCKKLKVPCSGPSVHTNHREYPRCYSTIGTGTATIDEFTCSMESADTVVSKQLHLKTLTSHHTTFNILTNTTTQRKFLRRVCTTVETLTTVHKAIRTLVPISVTIDVLTSETVCYGQLSTESAVVQTLTCSEKTIRVKTTYETERRRVTSTEGVIRHVNRHHEIISQSAPRTVTSICSHSEHNSHSNSHKNNSNCSNESNNNCSNKSNNSCSENKSV